MFFHVLSLEGRQVHTQSQKPIPSNMQSSYVLERGTTSSKPSPPWNLSNASNGGTTLSNPCSMGNTLLQQERRTYQMRAGDQRPNLASDKVPSPSALFLREVTTPRRLARLSLLCCVLEGCFQLFVRKQRRPKAVHPLFRAHAAKLLTCGT